MENKDEIDFGFYVNRDMHYKERAEILLKRAKAFKKGRRGNECFIKIKGIESLIGAGAKVLHMNDLINGDNYQSVKYKRRIFYAVTEKPFLYIIESCLR